MTDSKAHDLETDAPPDMIGAARKGFDGTGVPAPNQTLPGEAEGDVIGGYKLLQEIGEGGMGTVWMAQQSAPIQRKVALKIIELGMDTREVVPLFEAEPRRCADGPRAHRQSAGRRSDGDRPYFVMELARGTPITDYCDRAKLGLRERLELFSKVCAAIQHAHHKGVIHRDIKPLNVMVTLHDGVPVPKVIDFGIAEATSAELTQETLFARAWAFARATRTGRPERWSPPDVPRLGDEPHPEPDWGD